MRCATGVKPRTLSLYEICNLFDLFLYADDTALLLSSKCLRMIDFHYI